MSRRRHTLSLLAVLLLLGMDGEIVLETETSAMLEARAEYAGVPRNCLLVAARGMQLLLQHGIPAKLGYVDTDHDWHIYVCSEAACFDNGYLAPGLFQSAAIPLPIAR